MNPPSTHRVRRVVFTGGPGAGKTAIIDVLRRHLAGRIHALPESATMLFAGGFPRPRDPRGVRLVQRAVFAVQHTMEELCAVEFPGVPHICDRGSLDGAAFWPGGAERFAKAMETTIERELSRYEAVFFLETCAYADSTYHAITNPLRIETPGEARRVDQRLRALWSRHPRFHLFSHETNFYEKVAAVLVHLDEELRLPADRGAPSAGVVRAAPAARPESKRTKSTRRPARRPSR
jgi:hypothetical protein